MLWSGTIAGRTDFSYDNDFRIATLNVNGANSVSYGYDADSLLNQAGRLKLTRDARNGLLTGTVLALATDSYTYNGFGEVSDYTAKYNGSDLLAFQYGYDKLGRVVQKIETENNVTNTFDYQFNLAGHLIEIKKNGVVQKSYGYDSNGNRTTVNGTVIGTYDAQDRLQVYAGASYGYNANGDLTNKTVSGATTTYSYDVLGNLRQVLLPNNITVDYVIDGQNRRIGKKVNGILMQGFLYQDQLNPVAELDSGGNIVSQFIYADKSNIPAYMVRGGNTYRIISDHLGSPRLVINTASGVVVQRINYDIWGKVVLDTNPKFQPFGFAGGIYDAHTGFIRFGARDYDPESGRWTSKDSILFGGVDTNLYGYVLSDPVNFRDPLGKGPIAAIACGVGYAAYDWLTSLDLGELGEQLEKINRRLRDIANELRTCPSSRNPNDDKELRLLNERDELMKRKPELLQRLSRRKARDSLFSTLVGSVIAAGICGVVSPI